MAFISSTHIRELDDELVARNLKGKFIWRGLTRAPVIDRFTDNDMRLMKDTGAWKIALGIESGNDEILRSIRKKVKVEQVVRAVARLGEIGIQTKGFFIFGFPGETESQMLDTRRLIKTLAGLGMTEISAFQLKPYPGTEVYRQVMGASPSVGSRLTYLRRVEQDGTKAHERASDTPWLPDNLEIAAVPSRVVREHVVAALEDFYGNRSSDNA